MPELSHYRLVQLRRAISEAKPLDDAEGGSVLIVREGGSAVRLSAGAFVLLKAIATGADFDRIATVVNAGRTQIERVPAPRVKQECERLRELFERSPSATRGDLPGGFWIKQTIVPGVAVQWLGARLSKLFSMWVVLPLLIGVAATAIALIPGLPKNQLGTSAVFSSIVVLIASVVVHELGHAAACSRFKAKPGEIGAAIYLIYPVLYTDLNAAWSLRRWQRVCVDLGGVYFQGIFLAACLVVYRAVSWKAIPPACAMILISLVVSLNPVLKFDGYWAVADSLGVPNLSTRPLRLAQSLARRVIQRRGGAEYRITTANAAVLIYSVAAACVWAVFLWSLVPTVEGLMQELAGVVQTVAASVESGSLPHRQALEVGFATLSGLAIFCIAAVQAGRSGLRRLRLWLARRGVAARFVTDRPVPDPPSKGMSF